MTVKPTRTQSPPVPKVGDRVSVHSLYRDHSRIGSTFGIRDLASSPVPKHKLLSLGKSPPLPQTPSSKGCVFLSSRHPPRPPPGCCEGQGGIASPHVPNTEFGDCVHGVRRLCSGPVMNSFHQRA